MVAKHDSTATDTDTINLLVVKPSSLGDIIHAFPAVTLLRQRFPNAMIAWMANDNLCSIVDLCPAVDQVIPFHRQRWRKLRHCWELIGFAHELQLHNFDAVLDFQGLLRSALLSFFAGRHGRRIGFANAREGATYFYNERVLLPANIQHAVERNLFLVRSAFEITADLPPVQLVTPAHIVTDAAKLLQAADIGSDNLLIAVAPAARWLTKQWSAAKFAAVLDRVAAELPQARFWICGADHEQAIGNAVVDACRTAVVLNFMGQTNLALMAELLRQSQVLISNDSGPMHLAAVAGTAVVAIFGPTDPTLTGPFAVAHNVFRGNCPQAPCLRRKCPAAPEQCFVGISVEQVAAAVVKQVRAAPAVAV